MSTKDVVWSHTEALLAEVLGCDPSELSCDADGDWPVRARSGGYWVRVLPGRRPHVEVFSRVVEDIDLDPGLLEEINDWNRRLAHANAFWRERTVWVTGMSPVDCFSAIRALRMPKMCLVLSAPSIGTQ